MASTSSLLSPLTTVLFIHRRSKCPQILSCFPQPRNQCSEVKSAMILSRLRDQGLFPWPWQNRDPKHFHINFGYRWGPRPNNYRKTSQRQTPLCSNTFNKHRTSVKSHPNPSTLYGWEIYHQAYKVLHNLASLDLSNTVSQSSQVFLFVPARPYCKPQMADHVVHTELLTISRTGHKLSFFYASTNATPISQDAPSAISNIH